MNENGMVKQELDILEEGAEVYKLIGPALVKQDLSEARTDIARRIEFITKETEKALKVYEAKATESGNCQQSIMRLQQEMQASASSAALEAGAAAMSVQN